LATRSRQSSKPVKFLNLPAQQRALKTRLSAAVNRVIASSRFILGPEVAALEREVAAVCGAKFGVGVNSGTDALLLALRALGIGPGDEVLVPDFTFVATASAVLLAGATPVLVDVEPGTLTLDPALAAKAVTRRTRAVIPVHLYGQAADMRALLALAHRRKLAVIEDACQSIGAKWHGHPLGALGDAGALSFFPTKNLGGLGDGGMLVTNRPDVEARVRRLRDHGSHQKYLHEELGYNSRLDEIQAAALRVKLPWLAHWNARRRSLAARYTAGLAGLSVTAPAVRPQAEHVYHQYALLSARRDELRGFLEVRGIETAIHYPLPLHRQPLLARLPSARRPFPVSERAAQQVLCLPIAPETTDREADTVIAAIKDFV
jgi:dTDP-4-amino-4,6-dideoxygalactose transaminase